MKLFDKSALLALSTLLAGGSAGAAGVEQNLLLACESEQDAVQALEQILQSDAPELDDCKASILEALRQKELLRRARHAAERGGSECIDPGGY